MNFLKYLKESREEMMKVTWPSRKETTKYVIIIVAISLIIAGFFGGLDWLLTAGLEQLVTLTS